MNNHLTNPEGLRIVATALAELNEKVIFVGGATVSLYANDPAAAEPRPTYDIDVVLKWLRTVNSAVKLRNGYVPDSGLSKP